MNTQALRDAILAHLRRAPGPETSRDLARRFLKIDSPDEATCRRLLVPLLEAVPGVTHRPGEGWVAARGGPPGRGTVAHESPPRQAPPREPSRPESPALPRPPPGSLYDFIALASDGAGPAGSGSVRVISLLPVLGGEPCQDEHLPDRSPDDDAPADDDLPAPSAGRGAGLGAGPTQEDLETLVETVGDLPLVCHRVGREVEPVRRACAAAGLVLGAPRISAAKLGHLLLGLKANHTTLDLAAALGVEARGPDDCRGRVRVVAEAYLRLVPLLEERGIDTLELLLEFQEMPAAPLDLSRYAFTADDLKALPAVPGVYRFLDREGAVIYVGKSKNLRARVGSYFVPSSAGTAKGRAILGQVHRLEVESAASELEAALVEAGLIAEHRPRLNRQFEVHERPAPYGPRLNLAVVTRDAPIAADAPAACTIHFTRGGRYVARLRGLDGTPGNGAWSLAARLVDAYFGSREPAMGTGGTSSADHDIDWQLVASYVREHRDEINILDLDECGSADEAMARLGVLVDAARAGTPGRVVAR